MSGMLLLFRQNRSSIIAYLSVAALVLVMTALAFQPARDFYRRFLGGINPFLAISVCILLGIACLIIVTLRGWLSIVEAHGTRRAVPGFVFAAILPLVAIVIDVVIRFPKDMNQSFPASIAFYPSIGFLVEVIFHLVPITILLLLLSLFLRDTNSAVVVWSVLLVEALIEPLFQINTMAPGKYPLAGQLAVLINILIFNIIQVVIFKRVGFLAMYGSRMLYYLVWHIIWGHFRLTILFS